MYVNSASQYFFILTVILTILGLFCDGSSIKSTVHFEEEKSKGSFIVNVAELFQADKLQVLRGKLTFQLLSQKLKTSSLKSEIRPTSWVEINPKTGVMTSSRRIDRDAECRGLSECIVHIQVVMLPQIHFTFLDLFLVIDDVNDNPPTFNDDVITINVKENYDVGKFYNLDAYQAKDIDTGNNSKTRYELSPNAYFSLEQTNSDSSHLKLKLEKSLDYEKETEISMTLSATDRENPSFKTQVGLKVLIEDINDNSPTFEQKEYTIKLLENTLPGHVIGNVTAHDDDSGLMGEVKYYISTRNNEIAQKLFSINFDNGELKLKERVDREKHNGARILVEARDDVTTNQKIGEAWLDIEVEDVNDNSPIINTVFILHHTGNTVYISESAAKGTYLMRISASDRDSGENGKVKLTMESTSPCDGRRKNQDGDLTLKSTFLLHSDGLIATTKNLDRESCDTYIVTISACDHGNPAKCTTDEIKVVVLDENEHAPRFLAPVKHVTIRENTSPGVLVTTVRAFDKDSEGGKNAVVLNSENIISESQNGVVNYKITSGDKSPFSLNRNNGEIRLLKSLDREIKNEWRITITAQDGAVSSPRKSSCIVIINVDDVNDNAPQFMNPNKNNTHIYASILEDKIITKLMAKDPDFGANAQIRFKIISEKHLSEDTASLQQNSSNPSLSAFVLNPSSGELRLNFSRENKTNLLGKYTLIIQVYDLGVLRKSSDVVITISVSDSPIQYLNHGNLMSREHNVFLIAIAAGSASVLILGIIIIILVIRFKRNRKESKIYTLSVDENDDVTKRDDEIVDVTSALCFSEGNEEIEIKDELTGNGATTTTKLMKKTENLNSKNVEHDMEYLTVSRQNIEIASSSHWDNDSGRGDSDADIISCKRRSTPCPESDQTNKMGKNCTDQCVILGHSDSCWMPFTEFSPVVSRNISPQGYPVSHLYDRSFVSNRRDSRSQFCGNNADNLPNTLREMESNYNIRSPTRHVLLKDNSESHLTSQQMQFQANMRASVASTSRLMSSMSSAPLRKNSTTSHLKNMKIYAETTTNVPQQSPSFSNISLHGFSRNSHVHINGNMSNSIRNVYDTNEPTSCISNFESVLV